MHIKVIAFDADDTLWVNEAYFQETEKKFCALPEDYLPHHTVSQELFKTELQNILLYGYGIKGFMLCMIETALRIFDHILNVQIIEKAIEYGKELLQQPIELLNHVEDVLKALKTQFKLEVVIKGDVLDQERKLKLSVLESYFHHIKIMSDKQEKDYSKLIKHLDIRPEEFLMIGNSLKSDVIPVLALNGHAHEGMEHRIDHPNFGEIKSINDILPLLLS